MGKLKALADEKLSFAFKEYGSALEKYCRVRLKEAYESTDDCVQEAFCVYYKKLLDGENIEQPKAFLYRTADNMVKRARAEFFKNATRQTPLEDAEGVATELSDEIADAIDYEKLAVLILSSLNEKEKALYQMKYVEKKSLKEIGILLSIPPSTVANRTSRLRQKVRSLSQTLIDKL